MSDSGLLQTTERRLAEALRRIENLERRALSLGTDTPEQGGCCTVYCCNDNPGGTLAIGQVHQGCAQTIDSASGVGARLSISGFVVVRALAAGVADTVAACTVAGTVYQERSHFRHTVALDDTWTLQIQNDVDVAAPAPVVTTYFQNQGVVNVTLDAITIRVEVGPLQGSVACGEAAGQ